MIRRWCIYLTALLGALAFLLIYQGWIAWVLLTGLLWLPLFSLVMSLPAMLTARVAVAIPQQDKVLIKSTVTAKVSVKAVLPLPPYRIRMRVRNILTDETRLLDAGDPLLAAHAGLLEYIPEKCRVYDYLGLFGMKIRKIASATVTVWPLKLDMDPPEGMEKAVSLGWKPKPGGGFSENHDMRLFRPGDSLNLIHWKLTAKTGKLIVREPLEPLRRRILLTLDMTGNPDALDRKLGQLLWMGEYLLAHGYQYEIRAVTGAGLQSASVTSVKELENAVSVLLCLPRAEADAVRDQLAPGAWCFHIGGEPDER